MSLTPIMGVKPILEKRLIAQCNRVLIDEIDTFAGRAGAARLRPKEDSR
jgi:hypothetical protein